MNRTFFLPFPLLLIINLFRQTQKQKEYLSRKMSAFNINKAEGVCRICLLNDDNLIKSPCGCSGSVSLIHQKCFIEWVKHLKESYPQKIHRPQAPNEQIYQVQCELCKYFINFEIEESVILTNQLLKQIGKKSLIPIFVFSLLILPMILLIIFCGPQTHEGKVFIAAIIFLGFGLIVFGGTITGCLLSLKERMKNETQIRTMRMISKI